VAALEQVLAAVQQRLQRERRAAGARQAAWGSVVVALLAVLVHLWVRPIDMSGMLAAVALPWGLALLQSMATRPRPAECAQWADRHLGGQSGFVTLQELAAARATTPATAFAHLEAWLDDVARRGLARLDDVPLATSLARPLAAALVCASLAVALLQLPAPRPAASRAAPAGPSMAATEPSEAIARPGSRSPEVATASRATDGEDAQREAEPKSSNASPTAARPSPQQAAARDDAAMQARDPPPGTGAAARAAATGREAGDSADAGGDAALVAPWQGDLVSRLREITSSQPPRAGRAEPTATAEYAATAAIPDALPDDTPPPTAAAEPPPAASSLTLGPAEQAYVRAYWTDTGAKR
jgi:hypothetical protein